MGTETLDLENANRLQSPISDVTTGIGDVRAGYAAYGKVFEQAMRDLIGDADLAAYYDGKARMLDVSSGTYFQEPAGYLLPSGRVLCRKQDPACKGEFLTLYASIEQYKTTGHAGEIFAGGHAA